MKKDKITKLFNKETKLFHEFVEKPEDVKVVVLNHQQIKQNLKKKNFSKYLKLEHVNAIVQISLCHDNSAIKITGYGPDVVSAFYVAKNRLIKALTELETRALSEEESDSLPSQIQVLKLFH
jgi:hypothetical protein